MALPAYIDRLDDVPEAFRAHYVPTDDGKFRLDAEGIEDVSGLKSALEKERDRRREVMAERDALREQLGMEPSSDAEEPADDAAPEMAGEEEQPESEPVEEAPPASDEDVPEPVSEPTPQDPMAARLIEVEARAAILAENGVPELLLPILLAQLTVVTVDGGPVVRTLEEDGGRSVLDPVRSLKEDPVFGRAFRPSAKTGSGAPNQAGTGGGDTVSINDQAALDRNVADIAAGRVRVV